MSNEKIDTATTRSGMNIRHVMVDIETLGAQPGCPILAIGACDVFETEETGARFYRRVDLDSALEFGRIEPGTLRWWMKQGDQARKDAFEKRADDVSLELALYQFGEFLGANDANAHCNADVCVWGNGSDFDNAILSAAYRDVSVTGKTPWAFWNNRCYRTLKSLYPNIKMVRSGTHHNALDDALSQAEHMRAINELGSAGERVIR